MKNLLTGIFILVFGMMPLTVCAGEAGDGSRFMMPLRKHLHSSREALTWGRNPFVLNQSPGKAESGLNLSGILWDKTSPHAIVNGTVVSVGEEVNGFKVLEITPAKVVLDDGSGPRELQIG